MPNTIKYSTTGDTLSLKKGNFFIGVGDVGKGPSNLTGHYQGITPPTSGYTIYVNTTGSQTTIFCANSDAELIRFTNGFSGQNFTTATQCLNWYATQSNYVCVNEDYESIITNGLVLNLDAGFTPSYTSSGTTWYDLSHNGNNVTLTNGPTFNSSNGGSIVFDGVDDYARNNTPTLPTGNLTTTICVWTYVLNTNSNWQGFAGWGNTTSSQSILLDMNNGRLALSTWGSPSGEDLISNYTVPKNVWKYLVGSINNKNMKLYSDGTNVLNSSITSTPNVQSTNLRIATTDYPGRLLNNRISSIQVYNRELSESEIIQNYQAQFPKFLGQNIVMNGLVNFLDAGYNGSYPSTGTTWTNISGVSGGTGTLTNGPTYSPLNGGYIDFDGTNDFVSIPYNSYWDNNVFGNATNFTISCWAKCDNFFNWACLIQKAPDVNGFYSASEGASLWVSSDGFQGAFGNGVSGNPSGYGNILSFSTSNTNGWFHLLFTGDGTTGRLYVNGSLATQGSLSRTLPVTTSLNGPKLGIRSNQSYYNGKIANTLLYTRPLSATEVLQNYQAQFPTILGENIITNGLVLYLDAGYGTSYPGTGTTWTNVSGINRNVTLANGPIYTGTSGGAIIFDGVDDKATISSTIAEPTGIRLGSSLTPWMVNVWIKTTASGSNSIGTFPILTNQSGGPVYSSMGIGAGGVLKYAHYDGSWIVDVGTIPINNGNWHMVTWVNLDNNTMNLYVDGVFDRNISSTIVGGGNINPVDSIGYGWSGYLNASIATVAIYKRNYSYSSAEVLQNFNAQKSRFGL